MQAYNKAIAAFLTQLAALLATFGIDPPWLTSEMIGLVATVATTLFVYLIPNR